jgi:hypothetical protein
MFVQLLKPLLASRPTLQTFVNAHIYFMPHGLGSNLHTCIQKMTKLIWVVDPFAKM